jgi:tetratricopeptide (TPR) repeat protein
MKELVDSLTLPQMEAMLDNLERRAHMCDEPAHRARGFNLAGDVCFDAGQPERALGYYDKAINTYTDCHQYEIAARLCEKIVAIWPDAVRTHWTLAWIALKRGNGEAARQRIADYVIAAEKHGLGKVACTHLMSLAELTDGGPVLESIADALLQLDDGKRADAIYGRMRAG